MRRNHHEVALNAAGFAITIAPVVVIATQIAVRRLRRRKRGGQ